MENHEEDVKNVDVLVAPHHGRSSGRDYKFLDVVNPTITLFGVAPSEHLAYSAWNYRNLAHITNNQAGSVIINTDRHPMILYATDFGFARKHNPGSIYDELVGAYPVWNLRRG